MKAVDLDDRVEKLDLYIYPLMYNVLKCGNAPVGGQTAPRQSR